MASAANELYTFLRLSGGVIPFNDIRSDEEAISTAAKMPEITGFNKRLYTCGSAKFVLIAYVGQYVDILAENARDILNMTANFLEDARNSGISYYINRCGDLQPLHFVGRSKVIVIAPNTGVISHTFPATPLLTTYYTNKASPS